MERGEDGRLDSFRRTLVGLKQEDRPEGEDALAAFQTNPCGVEARATGHHDFRVPTFQTNPCGVEAREVTCGRRCCRVFQTNPCGVEAFMPADTSPMIAGFRRTLVGLKRGTAIGGHVVNLVSDEPLWG